VGEAGRASLRPESVHVLGSIFVLLQLRVKKDVIQQVVTEPTFEGSGTSAPVSKISHNSGSDSGRLQKMCGTGAVERAQQNY